MLLDILKAVGALGTIVTGVISLVRPLAVTGFTGLNPNGARGLSEIRAVLGGLFIGAGTAALLRPASAGWALGMAYLGTAAGRLLSIVVDQAQDRSNWISLVWEIAFGIILAL